MCSMKKGVLGNFTKLTGKHLCESLFFKKETQAQMLSCEFCEISKNTFLYRTPPVAASEGYKVTNFTYSKSMRHRHGGRLHIKMIKQIKAKIGEERRN